MSEFLNQLKKHTGAALSGAMASSRDRLALRQRERDLDRLYWKLGKEAIALLEAEEINHPALHKRRERIQAEISKIEALKE